MKQCDGIITEIQCWLIMSANLESCPVITFCHTQHPHAPKRWQVLFFRGLRIGVCLARVNSGIMPDLMKLHVLKHNETVILHFWGHRRIFLAQQSLDKGQHQEGLGPSATFPTMLLGVGSFIEFSRREEVMFDKLLVAGPTVGCEHMPPPPPLHSETRQKILRPLDLFSPKGSGGNGVMLLFPKGLLW